jgi:hypothetical protein
VQQSHPLSHVLEVTLAEKPLRWFWGLIQLYSLVFSFMSLMQVNACRQSG